MLKSATWPFVRSHRVINLYATDKDCSAFDSTIVSHLIIDLCLSNLSGTILILRGRKPSFPQIFETRYARTVRRRTTKYCTVTLLGRSVFLGCEPS